LQAYVDAGVDWVAPVDYLPIISDPAEAAASLTRSIDICSILKGLEAPACDGVTVRAHD